jgi:hypothetical protein
MYLEKPGFSPVFFSLIFLVWKNESGNYSSAFTHQNIVGAAGSARIHDIHANTNLNKLSVGFHGWEGQFLARTQ